MYDDDSHYQLLKTNTKLKSDKKIFLDSKYCILFKNDMKIIKKYL